MRRWALLLAGAALWLFLAAIPALADGGPHVATANSGVSTLTADGCAGCHRAHTAQGQYLIKTATTEELCLNCHGSSGTGASVNVEDGVQYTLASRSGTSGTVLGALRNGGFVNSAINNANPMRVTYMRTAVDASFRAKIPAASSAGLVTTSPVTSAHLSMGGNGVVAKNIAWGNGAAGAAAGNASSVALECTSCHNPHGNGQYRILNTLPSLAGNGFVDPVTTNVTMASASTGRFTTATAHGLIVGDIVTLSVAGSTPAFSGQYIVKSIPNGITFTVAAATTKTAADITGSAIGITTGVGNGSASVGTVQRYTALVDDAPLPGSAASGVADTVERNYTIQQVRGFQGAPTTYLLYTTNLGGSSFNLVADIVGVTASNSRFTTSLAHGLAIGDTVTIAGLTTNAAVNGSRTVATIPSSTTFTLSGFSSLTDETAAAATIGARIGTVTKAVNGTFGATAGDYFHRTVPWNPALVNAACPNNAFVDSTASPELASACLTAQDAPNGRPATVSSAVATSGQLNGILPAAYGQVAFNDQISAWCSTCHTRYYSSTNPNPGGQPNSSADVARTVSAVATTTITVAGILPGDGSTITSTGFSVGDIVTFSQGPANNQYYVMVAGVSGNNLQFRVSTTYDGAAVSTGFTSGTVTRLYPASASSWWYSRPGDTTYKYQHQTTTNRSCVTCHVSHGTSAQMPGAYSGTGANAVLYPDGSAGSGINNSRLLKIDNRGTCQMCHDPTGTLIKLAAGQPGAPGTVLPTGTTLTVP